MAGFSNLYIENKLEIEQVSNGYILKLSAETFVYKTEKELFKALMKLFKEAKCK